MAQFVQLHHPVTRQKECLTGILPFYLTFTPGVQKVSTPPAGQYNTTAYLMCLIQIHLEIIFFLSAVLFGFTESSSHTSLFPLSNICQLVGMELGEEGNV